MFKYYPKCANGLDTTKDVEIVWFIVEGFHRLEQAEALDNLIDLSVFFFFLFSNPKDREDGHKSQDCKNDDCKIELATIAEYLILGIYLNVPCQRYNFILKLSQSTLSLSHMEGKHMPINK